MKKKVITLIGVNFYPEDTAIGLYSTQMVRYFAEKGHTINVITGFPYYPQWSIREEYRSKPKYLQEKMNDINILRYKQYVPIRPSFLKRVIHLLDFTYGSYFNIRKIKQTDIIIVVVPFTAAILLGWLLKRRTKAMLWVHVQDFEFDAALQTNGSNNEIKGVKKIVFNLLFAIEKYLFSKVDVASTISYTMLEKLRTKTKAKIEYFPNWVDINKINPKTHTTHPYLTSSKYKILYSGNIGEKQDWNLFIDMLDSLTNEEIEIVVVGDGAKREWLVNRIKKYNFVKYFPPVPFDELSDLLCSADLHILFQKQSVVDTVMPSKLLGMMASSRPSLVTGNANSEVRKVLVESKGGIYKSNISAESIILEIKQLYGDKNKELKIGSNARKYVVEKYAKDTILSKIEERMSL